MNHDIDAWREGFEKKGEAAVRAMISNDRYNGQLKIEAERWLNEKDIAERTAAFEIAESSRQSAVSSKRAAWASVVVAFLALIVALAAFLK